MRTKEMKQELKHAGIGLLMGLLCLLFGILWAVYLTVNHESIHRQFEAAARTALEEKFVINQGGHEEHGGGHGQNAQPAQDEHSAQMHEGHQHGDAHVASTGENELAKLKEELAARASADHEHGGPVMETAHERLTRGHLHAMGLGVLTISVSLLLAFLPASGRAKTLAAACLGTGSFFYPLAWIVMGFRTTALGEAGAQASVFPMAAFSIALVAAGLLITLAYVIRWIFGRD